MEEKTSESVTPPSTMPGPSSENHPLVDEILSIVVGVIFICISMMFWRGAFSAKTFKAPVGGPYVPSFFEGAFFCFMPLIMDAIIAFAIMKWAYNGIFRLRKWRTKEEKMTSNLPPGAA